jgi:AraC-like DNA-binding protein
VEYGYCPVPAALRPAVKAIWCARGEEPGASFDEPIVPDGCVEVVFNLGDVFVRADGDMAGSRQPGALLVGQMTGPTRVRPTGRVDLVGVRFWPARIASVVRTPMRDLRDQLLPADCVLGQTARVLLAALGGSLERSARLKRLEAVLGPLILRDARPAPDSVAVTLAAIDRLRGAVRIERLARWAGVTRRHLERQYAVHVGLTPKEYARIVRVQHALLAFRTRRDSTGAEIAALCGFADQAHLIRDFLEIAGQTPSRVNAEATLSSALRSTA